ncbi:MAG: transcriptional repressor LexA [Clostridiales bacterium]|jgi:repressor LexA|nr:transcriptional repressor LexA [Clostridiales bacterium]
MRNLDAKILERVEEFVKEYQYDRGVSPSVREILRALRFNSPSTVHRYIDSLCHGGALSKDKFGNIEMPDNLIRSRNKMVPLVGTIACGAPILAVENIEESYSLPEELFGRGELFLLKAKGDSMIDAGIDSGDLVVIRRQAVANDGQIAAVLIEDEATLKRFYRDDKNRRFRLKAENDEYPDIFVENCEILGIAVKVIKSL